MKTASVSTEMRNLVELPNDPIQLILLKLPTESLIRFKAVSKTWKDLISTANFTYQHYIKNWTAKRKKNTFSEFMVLSNLCSPRLDKYFTRLSILSINGKLNIKRGDPFRLAYFTSDPQLHDYSSALFYPAGFGYYCLFEQYNKKVALWNPTIGEIVVVPWPSLHSNIGEYNYGFAQVEYKDSVFSYKVGLMRSRYEADYGSYMTIELYSSRENSWKVFKDCCCFKVTRFRNCEGNWKYSGTNLRGKFYFLMWHCRKDAHIVTFDMNTEEFGRLELPNFLKHDSDYYLHKSILTKFDENSLCLILCREHYYKEYLEAWVLSEYDEAWTLKSTARLINKPMFFITLGINDHLGGMFIQGLHRGDGLSYCSYGSRRRKTLMTVGPEEIENMHIVEYEESMVSLNGTWDQRSRREVNYSKRHVRPCS